MNCIIALDPRERRGGGEGGCSAEQEHNSLFMAIDRMHDLRAHLFIGTVILILAQSAGEW